MRSRSKLLWFVILAAGVLIGSVTIALALLAPMIVERALDSELTARGLSDAQFDVRQVGLRRAVIGDVRLGPGDRLSAETLIATYSPLGLLRGNVKTVRIVGARFVVLMRGERLDLGPVDTLVQTRRQGRARGRLPVERIELTESTLVVSTPQQQWDAAVEGVLERTPDGFDVQLWVEPGSLAWSVGDEQATAHDVSLAGNLRFERSGTGESRAIEATIELVAAGESVTAAGIRATRPQLGIQAYAANTTGTWTISGRSRLVIDAVTHPESGLHVEQVRVSLPMHYPLAEARSLETGQLWLGPLHWHGTTFAPMQGELRQHGDSLVGSLRWPLTGEVTARARGRVRLGDPLAASLELQVPRFALQDAEPLLALAERRLDGTVRGHASGTGTLAIEGEEVTQTLQVELRDVTVSRAGKSLRGLTGTLELDSVIPPRTRGRQRVDWRRGDLGQLTLGPGHIDFELKPERVVLVHGLGTELADRVGGGRVFVDGFRYAPGQSELRLDIYASALSLKHWLELLSRGKVTGTGKLYGQVSAKVQLEPDLRLHLLDGEVVADPGGTLSITDIETAEAMLTSAGLGGEKASLRDTIKQRLLEALQSLEYTALDFDLVRKDSSVTLQVFVSGRGTRGARQEIGGLTINVNGFEAALNELLRLRGGLEQLPSMIPEEVIDHAPSTPQP